MCGSPWHPAWAPLYFVVLASSTWLMKAHPKALLKQDWRCGRGENCIGLAKHAEAGGSGVAAKMGHDLGKYVVPMVCCFRCLSGCFQLWVGGLVQFVGPQSVSSLV